MKYIPGKIYMSNKAPLPLYGTLHQEMPDILEEMKNNEYSLQVSGDYAYAMISPIRIDERKKPVGFCCWNANHETGDFILLKAYILEKYRGNNLFYEHYKDMSSLCKGHIAIDTPNHFLIQSLMKNEEYIRVGHEIGEDLIVFKDILLSFATPSKYVFKELDSGEGCYWITRIFDFNRCCAIAYNPYEKIPVGAALSDVDIPFTKNFLQTLTTDKVEEYNKLLEKYTLGY